MIHAPAEAERSTRNAAAQINSMILIPPLELTDGGIIFDEIKYST